MQTRLDLRAPEGLARTLASQTQASVWAISGDDPLLTGEAADQCRQHFREIGVRERQVEVPDRSFDWKGWLAASGTASLFSEKRLMDLRLPTGKPGTEGSKALQAWCANPPADVILMVSLPRADRAMLNSSWFAALDQAGVVVIIPELYRSDLPSWVSQRLRAQGLTATPDAIALICNQCEGNLMAAHQEILKLALHGDTKGSTLDVQNIKDQVADVARFNAFALGEAVLGIDRPRAIRILRGLKAEAEPIPLVLWALTEDLRMLARTQSAMAKGRSADMAIREARIPRHRERLIAQAARTIHSSKTWRALRQAAEVDTIVKGLKSDDPWVTLERLVLDLA